MTRDLGVSKDDLAYVDAFKDAVRNYDSRFEPTFKIISKISNVLTSDHAFVFVIYAFLGVFFKVRAIQLLSNQVILALLCYLSYFFLYQELTQIRAAVATGIFLCSLKPLYNKKYVYFFLLIALAYFFHYSSLVALICLVLDSKQINKYIYIFLVFLSYLITINFGGVAKLAQYIPISEIQALVEMYKYQSESQDVAQVNIFNSIQLIRISVLLFLLFKIELVKEYNKYSVLLLKIYAISICSLILLSDLPIMSFRVAEFLGAVEIIILPLLVFCFKYRRLSKLVPVFISLVFLLFNLFYVQLFN